MEYLKKQIVSLCLFFTLTIGFQPLFATSYITLTVDNIDFLTDSIAMYYNIHNVPDFRKKVNSFLRDQLPDNGIAPARCGVMSPEVDSADFGDHISFRWQPKVRLENKGLKYQINSFSLKSMTGVDKQTVQHKISFKNLERAYYLFSFTTQCSEVVSSDPVIIIADKDIFFEEPIIETQERHKGKDTPTISDWQIAPNPFSDLLTINLAAAKSDKVQILLYDVNGQVHRQLQFNTAIGQQTTLLSTSDLPPGYYTLAIIGKQHRLQQKLVKLE